MRLHLRHFQQQMPSEISPLLSEGCFHPSAFLSCFLGNESAVWGGTEKIELETEVSMCCAGDPWPPRGEHLGLGPFHCQEVLGAARCREQQACAHVVRM